MHLQMFFQKCFQKMYNDSVLTTEAFLQQVQAEHLNTYLRQNPCLLHHLWCIAHAQEKLVGGSQDRVNCKSVHKLCATKVSDISFMYSSLHNQHLNTT